MDEENIRILSRVSGLEKHEYTKIWKNLEMPECDILQGVGPETKYILITCNCSKWY